MSDMRVYARVKFGDKIALLTLSGWRCSDTDFRQKLDAEFEKPLLGYHPEPWVAQAERAADAFGGEVLWTLHFETDDPPDTVY